MTIGFVVTEDNLNVELCCYGNYVYVADHFVFLGVDWNYGWAFFAHCFQGPHCRLLATKLTIERQFNTYPLICRKL